MSSYRNIYALLLTLVFCSACRPQNKKDQQVVNTKSETIGPVASNIPNNISRTIIQDEKGDIWIAAFDGIFRFDGTSFTHITGKVSSARFFSILEDSKGHFWFGSIGSGVYHYNGTSFQNYTTRNGLVSNEVVCIYEDSSGAIWFGANGGASRYDGKSFQNFRIQGDSLLEDKAVKDFPNFSSMEKKSRLFIEVNSIIEDKTGKFWFGTRGNTFVYDGSTFTTVTHNDTPFTNVRWIIEDRKGFIWLGGNDGLWRYDGSTFSNYTKNFVGYIYEDKKGNIWTSSQNTRDRNWILSRYNEKSLSHEKPIVTEIKSEYDDNKGMIFGILEANDDTIWFGGLDGVYLYDGQTVTNFKG